MRIYRTHSVYRAVFTRHIARLSPIVFRGTSGVSNPFRGERDHREHTAKRCWNAVPYEYDDPACCIGIQTDV